jgi:hypothetical protein
MLVATAEAADENEAIEKAPARLKREGRSYWRRRRIVTATRSGQLRRNVRRPIVDASCLARPLEPGWLPAPPERYAGPTQRHQFRTRAAYQPPLRAGRAKAY